MNNFFNKFLLLCCGILPFCSYADFTIKKVEINCPCPKKIAIEKQSSTEIDTSILRKINKLDVSEWNDSRCNEYDGTNTVDTNFSLNQSNTVFKQKNIPLSKFSIQKLFVDQAWLKVGNDIYIAYVGNVIGNVTIKKIDFDKKIVETSKGKIKK